MTESIEVKRPTWSDEMTNELADKVGKDIFDWDNGKTLELEECVEAARKVLNWHWNDGGFELAKEFEDELGISPDSLLVETLDYGYSREILEAHEKEWVKKNGIVLDLPLNTEVVVLLRNKNEDGIIVKLYHDRAKYGVRTASNSETSHFLINAEQVKAKSK